MKQCNKGSEAAERYVAGSMSEPERTGFEDHFFACHDCFRTVQGLEDARRVLVENAFPETRNEARNEAGGAGRISGHGLPYPWMAAAATLVIVAGLSLMIRRGSHPPQAPAATSPVTASPAPQPEPRSPTRLPAAPAAPPQSATTSTTRESAGGRLERWAAVIPPQYVSLTTRSAQDQEADLSARAFEEAMSHYSAGRYRQAADGLDAIAAREPAAAHIHFFLGISELVTGNVARAGGALRRSADAGTSPYSDEAHFYLAKAALRAGDLTTAARELEIAVDREAGPNGEAKRLLAEMRKVGR